MNKLEHTVMGDENRPCILFLHGWGGDLRSFSYFANSLSVYGYRTINLSFNGHGNSEKPSSVWGVSDFARAVLKLLKNYNVEKVSIVGHSFGGRVAIWLSANYPSLVDKLVLVDSAGIKPRRGLRYKYKVWRYKKAKKNGKDLSKFGSSDYKNLDEKMKGTFIKIVNEDLTKFLPKILVPTLLVWGKKDKDTPMYMAKKMRKKIKESNLVVFKNEGHWAYANKPNEFLKEIKSFLTL